MSKKAKKIKNLTSQDYDAYVEGLLDGENADIPTTKED